MKTDKKKTCEIIEINFDGKILKYEFDQIKIKNNKFIAKKIEKDGRKITITGDIKN